MTDLAWLSRTELLIGKDKLNKLQQSKGVNVVFSPEPPVEESLLLADKTNVKRSIYGTISYLPAAFGGICASVVIRDLMG